MSKEKIGLVDDILFEDMNALGENLIFVLFARPRDELEQEVQGIID
jgi:hypothetical protein